MRSALPCSLFCLMLAACSAGGGQPPSLQPRAAERIDPRVPVDRPMNDRPATPALAERLEGLVEQARAGQGRFAAAIDSAERLAASAGAPQSEGWIVAQEALSAAVEAGAPAATALGAIDSLGASLLAEQGGLAPSDQRAIAEAASIVGEIDRRQAAAIAAIKARLGG